MQATVPGMEDCISETAPPLIQQSKGHPKDLIMGILALKTHATILHKDCGLKLRALIDASQKRCKQLLLPDFNDQERTLRNTIEKLVCPQPQPSLVSTNELKKLPYQPGRRIFLEERRVAQHAASKDSINNAGTSGTFSGNELHMPFMSVNFQ